MFLVKNTSFVVFNRNWFFMESYYSVILEIGEEKALELFEATRGIEASGGMMIADGSRRRTPGGVFMTLFKTDPDILPVLKVRFQFSFFKERK